MDAHGSNFLVLLPPKCVANCRWCLVYGPRDWTLGSVHASHWCLLPSEKQLFRPLLGCFSYVWVFRGFLVLFWRFCLISYLMCLCGFVHLSAVAHGGQKRTLNPTQLELQVTVSHWTRARKGMDSLWRTAIYSARVPNQLSHANPSHCVNIFSLICLFIFLMRSLKDSFNV